MRPGWSAKRTSAYILGLAIVAALAFAAVYVYIYLAQPFSDDWNLILSDMFSPVASLFAALIATMIWARYDPTDAPRHIWGYFACGLWLWFAGELAWSYLNVTQGDVKVGLPDVFWVSAYFFFGRALLFQYQILTRPTRRELVSLVLLAVFCLLMLNLLIHAVLTSDVEVTSKLDSIVNSFYPAADLLIVFIALWFARNFIGGAFSRPWLGLLVFCFTDLMYAWLEISGIYPASIAQATLLSTIADIMYLGAYLVLGLGILSQWAFLKYGLRAPTQPQ